MKKKKLLVGKMKRFKALFITLVMVMFSGQIALAEAFELSGIVSGDVEEGVTITLSGNADEATVTTSGGAYSFLVDNGIYTVTPSLEMYSFVPENTEVTITGASVPQVDFVSVADEQDDDIDDDGVLNEMTNAKILLSVKQLTHQMDVQLNSSYRVMEIGKIMDSMYQLSRKPLRVL